MLYVSEGLSLDEAYEVDIITVVQPITHELLQRIETLQRVVAENSMIHAKVSTDAEVKWYISYELDDMKYTTTTLVVTKDCFWFSMDAMTETWIRTPDTSLTALADALSTGAELLFEDDSARYEYFNIIGR